MLGKVDIVEVDNERTFINDTVRKYNRPAGQAHSPYKPWPLIDLMVIKCNADVLAGGSIIVDLPGSSDVSATVLRATAAFKDKLQFTLAAALLDRSQDDANLQCERLMVLTLGQRTLTLILHSLHRGRSSPSAAYAYVTCSLSAVTFSWNIFSGNPQICMSYSSP